MLAQETSIHVRDRETPEARYIEFKGDLYETWTDNIRKLFDSYQREHGPCRSSIYIDAPDGSVIKVGWVFEKSVAWRDAPGSFIRETWVTLYDAAPDVEIIHHYHKM